MAQFRSWIGDKSSQTLGDYEREIYEWKGGPESERGYLAHLGASGLLIGRGTELGAIHHRPLRPIDYFYDSNLLLIPCNWTHPLSVKVSPLDWEGACWGCWVKGRGASIVGNKWGTRWKTKTMSQQDGFHFLAQQYWKICVTVDGKTNHLSNRQFCKEHVCWTCLGFINELYRERRDEGAKKGDRSKSIAASGSDGEGLQTTDLVPKGQLQQLQRRCGLKSPDTVLKITNPCQTHTY